MRLLINSLVIAAMVVATTATASPYDDAPWRSQRIVSGDTLSFWADPGIYDVARNGFMKWDESQSAVRMGCMNCAPTSWGAKEFWQYRMDQMTKEQNPRYLADLTFFFINVERRGSGATTLWFRGSPGDSVVVTLTDGTRLCSEPPKKIEVTSMVRRSEGFELTCRQAELQLAGQKLLTKSQIEGRRNQLAYRYARFNEFAVMFRIKDPPKDLFSRVRSIRVYFSGHPIDLERNDRALIGAR